MRILLLTFYYPPDLCAGSFRAGPMVKALRELGGANLHLDVITTMPNRYESLRHPAPKWEQHAGLTIRRIPLPDHQSGMADQARAFVAFARQVLRLVRGEQWDLVVGTSSRLMTAVLAAWVARRSCARLYLDIRDLFTDTMHDLLAGSPVKLLIPGFRMLERKVFRKAARINVVSAGFLPHINAVAPEVPTRLFTNGIDEEFLDRDFSPPSEVPRTGRLVLYAGNIGEGQGLHQVLPEFARQMNGEVRVRVIGDGGRRRELEHALRSSGAQTVELLAPVPRSELLKHYKEADILFLHLNAHAAFHKVLPSKIFEYASTGKPILAGVAGHAADFLREHVDGAAVFAPCDSEGMVDAVRTLLAAPIYRIETALKHASHARTSCAKWLRISFQWRP